MSVDPLALLFARGNAWMVRDVVVDGRTIVRGGRCTGVDLSAIETQLRALYRRNIGGYRDFERAWHPLSERMKVWFEEELRCY